MTAETLTRELSQHLESYDDTDAYGCSCGEDLGPRNENYPEHLATVALAWVAEQLTTTETREKVAEVIWEACDDDDHNGIECRPARPFDLTCESAAVAAIAAIRDALT